MSVFFLIMSLLSSVMIALLFKNRERRGGDDLAAIAANYPVALLLGLLLSGDLHLGWEAMAMAVIMGLLFLISFICYGRAISQAGIAASVTVGRMSMAIPVALSILIWGEIPKAYHWPALIVILLIIFFWEKRGKRISWLLLVIFTLFGIQDTGMKFFKMRFGSTDDGAFLLALFASAGFWAWLVLLWRKKKPTWPDLRFGFVLGLPNFFSSFFLLKALQGLPGYLVFPFVNVGSVLLASLTGYCFFDEVPGRRRIVLLSLGALAVLLLTV